MAITLVRRGYRTPEAARAFLEADESHPPDAFDSMGTVVERVSAAMREGRRITVHGDFDVDGVCATTILVGALRELGADCDWLIPDRIADGYGLSRANVERLAERGTQLLITVDCGITAVEEVALARSLGIEVVVTDHHQPGDELPDCPILHPALDGYPFERALRHGGRLEAGLRRCARRPAASRVDPEQDLDLVALATVADVVPLVGENRALVGAAWRRCGGRGGPGMRALLEAARCEPTAARRGRPGLPAGAADQRRRAPLPGRCGGRAVPHRGRGAGGGDRRGAEQGQRRAPRDRARGRRRRRGGPARAARRACARRAAWWSPARDGIPA